MKWWLVLEKQVKTSTMDYVVTKPDIMCLSKALTGGNSYGNNNFYTRYLWSYDDDINKALFHGHTFTANPTGQQLL
jgi:adenosylmethionine-8-amino-7-oxononanoate aminotransferase